MYSCLHVIDAIIIPSVYEYGMSVNAPLYSPDVAGVKGTAHAWCKVLHTQTVIDVGSSFWTVSNITNTHCLPQSGMRESHDREIELGDMEGSVLTALVSAMYGKLKEVPAANALPLFLAADKYQVQCFDACSFVRDMMLAVRYEHTCAAMLSCTCGTVHTSQMTSTVDN